MNTKNPKISIIIATYNSGKTLKNTLESVFNQDYKDWECIIVDGKSKDNTLQIVKACELKDQRFRHISERDNGIYDAFNKGWKMAKGVWIYYLGSDDTLTCDGFARLMKESHDEFEVITGDVYSLRIDGSIKQNLSFGFSGCHQGKLVRRSTIAKFNGFDESYPILADADLMIRMRENGIKVLNIHVFLAYFSMNGFSQKFSIEAQKFKERLRIHKDNHLPGNRYMYAIKLNFKELLSKVFRLSKACLLRKSNIE